MQGTIETFDVALGQKAGDFVFRYRFDTEQDRMRVLYENNPLLDTGCVGTGSGSFYRDVSYSGASKTVTIEVTPNCLAPPGYPVQWRFEVRCPE